MNLNQFYHYYKSKSGGGVSNFLKATEDFDSSIDWNKLPSTDAPTVSGGITDPNGGSDAQRINFTDNRQARVQQRVSLSASTQYTFSVYARVNTGTEQFRLRNVTLGEAEAKTATTSWTRFEYTFTTTTGGNYDLSIQNTSNDAKTIEFWGAMLNVGASANDYVKVDPSISGSTPTPAYSGFGDTYGDVTAYYSLRKFTEAETLNAIRVRRSSDDTEQDIGFDANGDLDTTALTTFVNANVNQYTSDFSSTEDLTENNGTGAAAQSVGGVDDAYKFTTITGTGQMYASIAPFSGKGGGNSFRVQADVYLPSTNSEIDKVSIWTGYGAETFADVTATDTWTSIDQTIEIIQGGVLRFQAYDGNDITPTTTGANVFYLKNIVVTQTTADGAVTTFYDQTGNGNDATNATASEQPLVVSGGTLVTENGKAALDFDGVDDHVKASISITDYPVTNAIVQANDPTNSGYAWSLNNDTQSTQYYSNSDYSSSSIAFHTIRNSASIFFSQSWTDDDQNLLFAYSKANNDHAFGVNGGGLNTSTNSTTFPSVNNIVLGRLRFAGSALSYLGKIQELIIFTSDQSSNRTGIETNINDHFDIYTP